MTPEQLTTLKAELTTDPLAKGYAALDNEGAANSLNVVNRQPDRASITGGQIASCVVLAELTALTAIPRAFVQALFSADEIPVTQTLKTELAALFGQGTTTRANLLAAIKRQGSRAEELGLGFFTPSNVADASRL